MDDFKIPINIPQDLLLIHELIGTPEVHNISKPIVPLVSKVDPDEDIASSGSEVASEDEIDAVLKAVDGDGSEEVKSSPQSMPVSSSDSDTPESSDAENEKDDDTAHQDLDDEDPVPTASTNNYFQTKHELIETDIAVPEIDEVGADEALELVGEVMNIMDKLVIIKGFPSEFLHRGSERALDSDTLLVFDDRKVLGYIYETFGPTSQPLYQVKFPTAISLNPERVRVGREVFHVPTRSHFVFVNQIKAYKGSDASNVHDEEPGDDELEFSDDEAEIAYRTRLKQKRRGESRARSSHSSRQGTPNPSHMRDQELTVDVVLSRNAYDENGPYDMDFGGAGPARPAPVPYNDPYSDEYLAPEVPKSNSSIDLNRFEHSRPLDRIPRRNTSRRDYEGRGRGRGRSSGDYGDRGRGRGAQGDRERGRHDKPRSPIHPNDPAEYSRSLSPTSLAIARATGQGPYAPNFPARHFTPEVDPSAWTYNHYQVQGPVQNQTQQFGYSQAYEQPPVVPFVQPHINPRFASAMGYGAVQESQQFSPMNVQYARPSPSVRTATPSAMSWADEWAVPLGDTHAPHSPVDGSNGVEK